jgi:transcriptional regulator with XRE-family HTH domain
MGKKSEGDGIDKVRAELVAALLEDESRLGDVYRMLREGLSAEEMAERLGIPSAVYTDTYRQQVDAILEGRMPSSSHLAQHTAGRLRRWQRQKSWTPPARDHLESLLAGLENIATDVNLVERERHEAARKTEQAERLGLSGIYVYSLPHYLRHPYDPETGRTLFKVGHSTIDVFSGAEGTAKAMTLPEDPVLVRVYVTGPKPADEEERHFHEWMEAAGHGRSRSSRGNRDWYLTTTKFLDRVAVQRGLEITVVSNLDGEA